MFGPVGIIRGLGEVVTCVYGPTVTYDFPDPLVVSYRHSVVHVSLISILNGTALNWCRQEDFREQMSERMLFGASGVHFQGTTAVQNEKKT